MFPGIKICLLFALLLKAFFYDCRDSLIKPDTCNIHKMQC